MHREALVSTGGLAYDSGKAQGSGEYGGLAVSGGKVDNNVMARATVVLSSRVTIGQKLAAYARVGC